MGESRKPAASARQSARARAAEKMAERKQREKLIAEELESFFAADLLVSDAESARDEAIAKAHQAYQVVTDRAREEKAGHARALKELGLTDREIADLIDRPVSAVKDLLKAAKQAPKGESASAESEPAPAPTVKPSSDEDAPSSAALAS